MTEPQSIRGALDALMASQREPRRYPFPYPLVGGVEIEVAIRLLTDHEIDMARIEAQRYCARIKADLTIDPDLLEREVQRQMVWRSTLEPFPTNGSPEHPRLFQSDQDVRMLPAPVIESLHRLYLEHQDRVSPHRVLTDENIGALVELVRARGSIAFSQYDDAALVRICIALAARVTNP